MEFATVALGALLPKLTQLLQDEYNLHKGVRKDIQFLTRELERTQAALREVGEVPLEQLSELVRLWAHDVREVSYDMEDIVDTFMVRVQGPDPPSKSSATRFIKKMFGKLAKAKTCHVIGQEIEVIKKRVMEIAELRDRYRNDAFAPAKKTHIDLRLRALYPEGTEIVGIEEAKKEIITMLTEGDEDQKANKRMVVSIVYDEIKGQFQCTAFVSVSRSPDTQRFFKDMLCQLDEKKFKDIHSKLLNERFLIDKAIEFLQNKRGACPSVF